MSVSRATVLAAMGMVLALSGLAFGQATNQITAINPNSAAQGTTNLLVTFTLDTDAPPAPPGGVMPNSVVIGSMSGTSVAHSSQYIVTAIFNIPAGEPTGPKDATITFTTPNGTLTFSMADGFTVTAGAEMPPSITQQPQSQTVPPGGSVTFTVAASGTPPLHYQWQKNDSDISGATDTSYTINPVAEEDAGNYRCVVTNDYGTATSDEAVLTVAELPTNNYPVVDTGQDTCYDNSSEITCPAEGQAFYGQDAQYSGNAPSYVLSTDGLTVYDNVSGLTWQRSPDTDDDGDIDINDKLTWTEAQAYAATLNAQNFGGYADWRLPTIKELYSLIDFRGTDPSGYAGTDTSWLTPFIDTNYFEFGYGDTSAGERIIDAQYASSTLYVGDTNKMFGVNLADGRIKGYDRTMPGGGDKTFYVKYARGNANYGVNNFLNNGDGTITDRATGLMWTQSDSGSGLNWESALAWVQTKNSQNHLGHNDWRLPNAKELQSIVDYTRCPDTSGSAAINSVFNCTPITNEGGQADYPYYWASTTHIGTTGPGAYFGTFAVYVCFGRGLGYMGGVWQDVHGAGPQRSDPKMGDPNDYPTGHGPQGDAVRIYNYVRLVRNAPVAHAGDLNCDGVVSFADINPFVLALGGEASYYGQYPTCNWYNADCNDDGLVSFADINPFVALLAGG